MGGVLEYESREERGELPGEAKAVAWVFVAMGVAQGIAAGIEAIEGEIHLNLMVLLYVGIGVGLLNRRDGWRTCALVVIWLFMIFIPVIFLAAIVEVVQGRGASPAAAGNGGSVNPAMWGAWVMGWGVKAGVFVVSVWQFRVLIRPDVRRCFERKRPRVRQDLNETWEVIDDGEERGEGTEEGH